MRPRVRLVLARHAESVGNAARVWQGQSGAGLTPRGRRQADALADHLAAERDVVAFVRSDLARTAETAAPLEDRTGWTAQPDPRWRELDVGGWSGRTLQEVAAGDADGYAAFRRGDGRAGGSGESLPQLRQRVTDAAAAVLAAVRAHGGGTAVVITHGWTLRVAIAELSGRSIDDLASRGAIGNAAVCRLEGVDAPLELRAYGEQAHLPAVLRAASPSAVA